MVLQVVFRLARYGVDRVTLSPAISQQRKKPTSNFFLAASSSSMKGSERDWMSLGASSSELRLEFTLVTGQSFRWRRTGYNEYTGVIQQRLVSTLGHLQSFIDTEPSMTLVYSRLCGTGIVKSIDLHACLI